MKKCFRCKVNPRRAGRPGGYSTCVVCHKADMRQRRALGKAKKFRAPRAGRPANFLWRDGMAHDARLDNKPCALHPGQSVVLEVRTVKEGYVRELGGFQSRGYIRRRVKCKVCNKRWTLFEAAARRAA